MLTFTNHSEKQHYLAYAELGSRAALDETLAHVFNDSGYRATWGRLLPTDKAVLRALAQGVSDLPSERFVDSSAERPS